MPQLPETTPGDIEFSNNWESPADPYSANHAANWQKQPDFGVGYLELIRQDANHFGYYDWLSRVTMPLWISASTAEFAGWLHHGRLKPASGGPAIAASGAGLVETDYELSNFIVYEISKAGWLRLRLFPGTEGVYYTHRCHLNLGKLSLEFRDWVDFLSDHGDWMHFRSQVTHRLRAAPAASAEIITAIGLDHKLELQEIQGDWMRVIVEQPDISCGDPDIEFSGSRDEGWVKWRDTEIGPWVWVYTRGC